MLKILKKTANLKQIKLKKNKLIKKNIKKNSQYIISQINKTKYHNKLSQKMNIKIINQSNIIMQYF